MKQTLHTDTASVCLWQQAGVVKKKACHHHFECAGCQFNRSMNRVCMENEDLKQLGKSLRGKRAKIEFWMDRLRKMPAAQRPCIHSMKGRIGFKSCPKAYHCNDCEFDLYFQDQFKIHTVVQPVAFDQIGGVSLPSGYYLHPGHAWIKLEEQGMVRIGIDDFSARTFGRMDRLEAPLMGKQLDQGHPMIRLFRNTHAFNFVAPVSGVVVEVNNAVKKNPKMLHTAPYTDGWIFVLYSPDLKSQLKELMFLNDSRQFIHNEMRKLYQFIEEKTQLKAADGGQLVDDVYGHLPGDPWDALVDLFIAQGV